MKANNIKQRSNQNTGTLISDSNARSSRKAYVLSAVLRLAPDPGHAEEGKGTQWKGGWVVGGFERISLVVVSPTESVAQTLTST